MKVRPFQVNFENHFGNNVWVYSDALNIQAVKRLLKLRETPTVNTWILKGNPEWHCIV